MITHLFFTFMLCMLTLLNAYALKTPAQNPKTTKSATNNNKINSDAQKVILKTHSPFKVINNISRKDLGYYKMFSWHYPDIFTLKVNNKIIEEGKSIECTEPILVVRYDYEWTTPWGKQIGAKEVSFEIPAEVTELAITFVGWQQEERINIANAKKITEEKLITS